MHSRSIVFIVASESATRRDLAARVEAVRLPMKACRSADELLDAPKPSGPACVLADLPRYDDLHWFKRLTPRGLTLPVVIIAAQADVSTAVRAMKLGSVDFLEMKCSPAQLGKALREALRCDTEHRRRLARLTNIRRRLARLNRGQREVLDLLLAGKCNREIAAELDLSIRAIEERRAAVMELMHATSFAELVRLAVLIEE